MLLEDYMKFESGTIINRVILYDDVEKGLPIRTYNQDYYAYDAGRKCSDLDTSNEIHVKATSKLNIVEKGDIILKLTGGECVMATEHSEGTLLPYNYSKVILSRELDPFFFLAWFNYSEESRKQIGQAINSDQYDYKITHEYLKSMKITIPSSEKQQEIRDFIVSKISLKRMLVEHNAISKRFIQKYLF
ncbi:restriction endonuclease subunit S [Macrococcoides canis]|uniref:restriction endonuclease subunit S n=1 Tax=Macrococcoides canis TaxID=1855823 RepID=UPI0020B6CFB3|nr:restriction endonuclease subunit S [Macrococcus canis]UTH00530.1 restriction endonuclease subunit S [Macrococcus canis]